jgi:hypothetical protein
MTQSITITRVRNVHQQNSNQHQQGYLNVEGNSNNNNVSFRMQ